MNEPVEENACPIPEPDLPWGFGHNGWAALPDLGWYVIRIASIRNRKMNTVVTRVHRAWHQDEINQQIALALGQLVAELNFVPTAPREATGSRIIVPNT